jgi:hypothetical protein
VEYKKQVSFQYDALWGRVYCRWRTKMFAHTHIYI